MTAFLHAGGAALFCAAWGQLSLSDAEFAGVTRIDACLHLRARLAFRRIVHRIGVATSDAYWVFRSEPYSVIDAWQCAATKTVASIWRNWPAGINAVLRLRRGCLGARNARAGNASSGIVRACHAIGWVIRGHFERVAFVAPVALVVTTVQILVEVTIDGAR